MTTKQKYALGIGGALLVAIVAYIFYRKRWKTFVNIGDSQWLPTQYKDGRLALEMPDKNHGFTTGQKIEVDHDNRVTQKGKTQVLDVVEKNGRSYVVTALKAPFENPDFEGKVRVVS
jgi:hypothetical protein